MKNSTTALWIDGIHLNVFHAWPRQQSWPLLHLAVSGRTVCAESGQIIVSISGRRRECGNMMVTALREYREGGGRPSVSGGMPCMQCLYWLVSAVMGGSQWRSSTLSFFHDNKQWKSFFQLLTGFWEKNCFQFLLYINSQLHRFHSHGEGPY